MKAHVYTTDQETAFPIVINDVAAVALTNDLLTVEAYVEEKGYRFSAFHRFEGGTWAHFEVFR